MPKTKSQPVTLSVDEVKKIVDVCGNDGHSILRAEALEGVNQPFRNIVTRTYTSNFGDHKSTIYDNEGNPTPEMKGVYTLDALHYACDVLQIPDPTGHLIGRGFQARALTEALYKWVKEREQPKQEI